MNLTCPYCNKPIPGKVKRCPNCEADISVFRTLVYYSNCYYNEGLAKAKVRDLSGATVLLRKSLQLNKSNIPARNLLGLVLFEMGESVAAMREWVHSTDMQKKANPAKRYLDSLGRDKSYMDKLANAAKQYNAALVEAKEGNTDLAVMQVKRAVSSNPKFVKALLLLALLHIRAREYSAAKKTLRKVLDIDMSNATALRLSRKMNPQTANTTDSDTEQSEGTEGMFSNPFAKVSLFKEDKPNILAWISLFVGIAIGCMFMYFVVVPSAKNAIRSQFESEERDYASQLNVQGAAIQSKESEIVQLQIQVSELEDRIGDLDTGMLDPFVYDPLFDAANMVIVLLKKGDETTSDEILATADAVFAMNLSNTSATESVEMSETAATLYATLCESSYPRAIEIASEKADQAYAADDYANATIYYQQVYNFDPDNAKAVYSLGLCYEAEGQFEQASMYYNIILELFPDSSYYQNAVDRLGGL